METYIYEGQRYLLVDPEIISQKGYEDSLLLTDPVLKAI